MQVRKAGDQGLAVARLEFVQLAAIDDARDEWLEQAPVLTPEPERREVRLDAIDNEDLELGGYIGLLSMEDFGVARVDGVTATYHVTEDVFLETFYGRSKLGLTSFERLSGGARLLRDKDRRFTQYGLVVGLNVLPGEGFIRDRRAVATGLYLVAGAGAAGFAGDQHLALTFGLGYRVLASDWLALRFDVRDHLIENDLLGSNKLTHNLEFRSALAVFF